MRDKIFLGVLLVYAVATIPFLGNLLLSYDEAHYALYGYYLDWSYFDHPPLVGWVQAFMQLLGDSEFLLRLPAFLCSFAILIGLWWFISSQSDYVGLSSDRGNKPGDIKGDIKGAKKGKEKQQVLQPIQVTRQVFLIASLLFLSIPMFMILSFALLPDSLLMALTLPLILQTRRTAISESWRDYIILGLLVGLAALAKYTAVLLALGSVSYILWVRGLKVFSDPRCWVASGLALLLFSPVIIWNLQSGASSFAYQLDHGLGREWLNWVNVLLSQLFQMLAYGPLVYCLSLTAMVWIVLRKRQELYIVLFFALPMFLVFLISPAFGKFLPHWVAAMFVVLLPAVAIMLYEVLLASVQAVTKIPAAKVKAAKIKASKIQALSIHSIKAYWLSHKFVGSMLILLLFLSFMTVIPLRLLVSGLEIKFPPYTNPQGTLIGWDDTAALIMQDAQEGITEDITQSAGYAGDEDADGVRTGAPVIFVNNWSYASSLAWYARPMRVVVLDKRLDQFDIWFGSPQPGQDESFTGYLTGYLVVPSFDARAVDVLEDFNSCELWDENTYSIKGSPALTLEVYKCEGLLSP